MQDEDTEELSAPFSAHARGVPLTGSEGFDWGQNAESLVMSLLDISGAALHLLLAQGWLTILQCIITVCATTFYTYLGVFSVEADLNFTIFGFVVLLPLVLTVFSSIGKRDQALRDLADMKTMLVHYKLMNDAAVDRSLLPQGHEAQLVTLLSNLIDAMRQYFMPQRFYSRHHMLMEVRQKMLRIAQGRSRQMLRVTGIFHQLSSLQQGLREAGIADVMGVEMSRVLLRLHSTFERMATVKEFRTPQGVRALLHVYIMLIEPLFFGPYYAFVRDDVHSFAFALFLVIVLNLATTSLLQVSIALEDPFDSQALDNIFADEALLEARLAIGMDRRQAAAYAADTGGMEETAGMRLRALGRSRTGGQGDDGLPAPTEDKTDTLPL